MKILILSTYRNTGGAAVAAERLMNALNRMEGVEADMLCRRNLTWWKGKPQSWTSIVERALIWMRNGFSTKQLWATDLGLLGQDITQTKEYREADVVHLHWVNQGFISLKTLQKIVDSGKQVVITMHDIWWCSATRHTPDIEDRGSIAAKQRIYASGKIRFVAVSSWLKELAAATPLMKGQRITVIPNTLSLEGFSLMDKAECRKQLGIGKEDMVIVFCAAKVTDPIKDFGMLCRALEALKERDAELGRRTLLRIIGTVDDATMLDSVPVRCCAVGRVSGAQEMCREYSAADIVACTSTYETFGQTLIEAQAAGALPVSFGNSGQRDIIVNKVNGVLVEERSHEAFAEGLLWAMTEGRRITRETMRENVMSRFAEDVVARRHMEVYAGIIHN